MGFRQLVIKYMYKIIMADLLNSLRNLRNLVSQP